VNVAHDNLHMEVDNRLERQYDLMFDTFLHGDGDGRTLLHILLDYTYQHFDMYARDEDKDTQMRRPTGIATLLINYGVDFGRRWIPHGMEAEMKGDHIIVAHQFHDIFAYTPRSMSFFRAHSSLFCASWMCYNSCESGM
jgi:hypothetical protein